MAKDWRKASNIADEFLKDEKLIKDAKTKQKDAKTEQTANERKSKTANIFPRDIGRKTPNEFLIYVIKKAKSQFHEKNFYGICLTGNCKGQTMFFVNFNFEPGNFYHIKREDDTNTIKITKITNEERLEKLMKLASQFINIKQTEPRIEYTTDTDDEEMPF